MSSARRRAGIALSLAWICAGASLLHAAPPALRFVRAGILVEGAALSAGSDVRVNDNAVSPHPEGSAWLLEWPWLPRRQVRVTWGGPAPGEVSALAPLRPAPWERWSAPWPPTDALSTDAADEASALAIAPQSDRLAAGSQQGRVAVFAMAGGDSMWSVHRPGRVIRQLAFDAAGRRLYVGEQGPEGRLAAYDVTRAPGAPLWTRDAAHELGGAMADAHDPYAWVRQPGVYRLLPLGDDLLVAISRSWDVDGRRRGRSRVYRLDGATGAVRWAFPAEGPQRGIVTWATVDATAARVAFPVQSPLGAQGDERRATEVILLDLASGQPVARRTVEPVPPYPVAGMWQGLALARAGRTLALATDDGRAEIWDERQGALVPDTALRLMEPVTLGGVTVAATNGSLAATERALVFATGPTYIPPEFGGGGEPKVNHPRGNTLFGYDWHGRAHWIWPLENDLQGVQADATGHWLAAIEGAEAPQPEDRSQGLLLLDLLAGDDGRLVYRMPLEGRPVYGALAFSADGRWIALAESPRRVLGEARPRGAARLHVVR